MRFLWFLNSIFAMTLAVLISAFMPVQRPRVSLDPTFNECSQARFRPTAIELDASEKRLVVCGAKGDISVIDTDSSVCVSETRLGKNFADLTRFPDDSNSFLAVDSESHQLVQFHLADNSTPKVNWTLDVCKYPGRVAVTPDGLIAVSGSWSRQLSFAMVPEPGKAANLIGTLDLDFVPGKIIWLDHGLRQLLVVDAFGNRQAIVQLSQESIQSKTIGNDAIQISRELPDRRVGGVTIYNDQIVFATQMLNPLAHSTYNDVHWGLMVSNDIESFPIDKFTSDQFNFSRDRDRQPIGGAGEAKSDAECIVVTQSKLMVVALGGTGQVAIGSFDELGFAYLFVGKRPVDLVINQDESTCYVVNQLDSSISVVDLENLEVNQTLKLNEDREYTLEEQGERLFYDASLSHDGWMSCHSCHVNGHTSGLANDNLSDGSFGTPKQVVSLLGHSGTEPMAWNGGNETLEEQVQKSLKVTMQSDNRPADEQVAAIVAFVKQLPPPPSLDEARGRLDPDTVAKGEKLFHQLDCARCHAPPSYTSPKVYDVDLKDEKGETRFNPPSLIGLGQRDSFFHDGRVRQLEEVFTKIEHQLPNRLSDEKLSNLLAFLKSL